MYKEDKAELTFTKDNLNDYLKELGKEYKKMSGGKLPIEIVLIGGAAIIANYGFRDMTTDVDALIQASGVIKDAINVVGNRHDLPHDWLNSDFTRTASYSRQLSEISVPYRQYSNILNIRVVTGEYLIAMKLRSGRRYKNDLSDIVGIIIEQKKNDKPIDYNSIMQAYKYLYGNEKDMPESSKKLIENIFNTENLDEFYDKIKINEAKSREALIKFAKDYPDVTTSANVNDILDSLDKRDKGSVVILPEKCISFKNSKGILEKIKEDCIYKEKQ